MPKFNNEYVKLFFEHFGIYVDNLSDVKNARRKFKELYGKTVSFSDVKKGYKYSDKVFSIHDIDNKTTVWYSSFDDLITEFKNLKNSKYIISMPKSKSIHEVLYSYVFNIIKNIKIY